MLANCWHSPRGIYKGHQSCFALRVPIRHDDSPRSTASTVALDLVRRANQFEFESVDQEGDNFVVYVGTLTVAGIDFVVQLDTGSSDLWIDVTKVKLNNVQNTRIHSGITYYDTTQAEGDVLISQMKFGDFIVDQQAFIGAVNSNATLGELNGVLGIGPPLLSNVEYDLGGSPFNGATFLENVFATYQNESNFMTFQLARSTLGTTDGGVFTIGEVDSNFTSITNTTHLDVLPAQDSWIAMMDSVGFNGEELTGHGFIDTIGNPPKLFTLVDTGTSLWTAPPFYVDAIYKNLTGAQLTDPTFGYYTLPCDTKINVSMIFNGQEYPVHPLDMTTVTTSNDNRTTICVNTMTYTIPRPDGVRQDFILGDSFLRNVYSLFDFGSFTNKRGSDPFIQLLSVTDKDKAWEEFDDLNNARIQQWNTLMINSAATSDAAPAFSFPQNILPIAVGPGPGGAWLYLLLWIVYSLI